MQISQETLVISGFLITRTPIITQIITLIFRVVERGLGVFVNRQAVFSSVQMSDLKAHKWLIFVTPMQLEPVPSVRNKSHLSCLLPVQTD